MPAAPARPARLYYGWAVLLVAAAAMVGTRPGRTQGLGLITEPLIADLGLDRVTYAQLNFWATILGAGFALGIGRLLDAFGGRIVLTVVAVALGLVVCGMARAASLAQLAVWVTLTRGLGQSALSVISIALVGHWFARRIDTAMAVYSIVLSVGFMAAFPLVGWLVQAWGWRGAWLALGAALIGGLAPLSGLAVLPYVRTMVQVMSWAATMGIGGGIVMVLFFSVWPRVYGRRHLGRIQGSAQALTVLASAVGPLLLALCVSWTGSYQGMFRILALAIGALPVPAPPRPP